MMEGAVLSILSHPLLMSESSCGEVDEALSFSSGTRPVQTHGGVCFSDMAFKRSLYCLIYFLISATAEGYCIKYLISGNSKHFDFKQLKASAVANNDKAHELTQLLLVSTTLMLNVKSC